MAPVHEIILLFTRFPQAGNSKTRLIPALGPEKAADLQRIMTRAVLHKILEYSEKFPCKTIIYHEGGSLREMREWLGESLLFQKQHQGDLGERMFSAMAAHLSECRALLLVGSDCPSVDSTIFRKGFTALRDKEVVIGPAFDGGYYLIGVQGTLARTKLRRLFSNIRWGSPSVLCQTLAAIETLHLNHHLLKQLHDIDTPEDLKYFHHHSDT